MVATTTPWAGRGRPHSLCVPRWRGSRAAVICWWLVLVLAMLLMRPGGADAAVGHRFLSRLSEGSVAMSFLKPGSVAVDRESGLVFVGDPLAGYVDVYSVSGGYVTRFGGGTVDSVAVAVDEASGDVYVADPFHEAVVVFAPDGQGGYRLVARWYGAQVPGNEFGEVVGVAVDNSAGPSRGDLYVVEARGVDAPSGAIDVFRPRPTPVEGEGEEGEFLGRLSGGKPERPNGVAVSTGTGRVLVADARRGAVLAYNTEGVFEEKLTGKGSPYGSFKGKTEELGNVAGVAVDEASGEIYVTEAERGVVSEYSATGVWEGWITSTAEEALGEPRGVALTPAGDVYVAEAGAGVVDRFGPGVVVPSVETGKVAKSGLTRISAQLRGTINGEGETAEYSFQYGDTPALGTQTEALVSGSGEASVMSEATPLEAGSTYYYRIVGQNANGANVGLVRSFETPPAVEELSTGPAEEVQPDSATLTGSLNCGGVDVHYYFQWGTTTAYGSTTPLPPGTDAGSGTSIAEARAVLSGLSANTTYHYRLVGEDSFGTTYGADETFATAGPPLVSYEPPNEITQHEATIAAQITPDQLATTYRFEYGETAAYGNEAPVGGEAIGAGTVPLARLVTLTSLKVGTVYHYRVVAENKAGITAAPDQTFMTVLAAPVNTIYATGVSATDVVLHAQINPLGNDTRYYFQYGTEDCRANPGACTDSPAPPGEDIGSAPDQTPVENRLTGLRPGTTYHYRAIATNALGTGESIERTFTTLSQEGASFALPDHRAWEMVTPPDKGGAPVEALTREGGIILASTDGNTLAYVVNGALGEEVEGNRSPEVQQILATRSQTAWESKDIATPSVTAKGVVPGSAPLYQAFSTDLTSAIVEPPEPSVEPPLAEGVTQGTMYRRDNATGAYLPLVTETDTAPGTHFDEDTRFSLATPDLGHVVIRSSVALLGPGSRPGLYEWSAGHLSFVSVRPNGKAASAPELGLFGSNVAHALSDNGSRIVWTNKEDLNTRGGHLYLRDVERSQTVQLDAAQGVVEPEKGSAQFQGASADGSRIFFTDRQRLTPDSTAEPGQGMGKPDLYECEIIEVSAKLACELTDLTMDPNAGEHANVQGLLLGINDEGTSVYLVAQGVLASNRNGNGEEAKSGEDNLYALHYDGVKWSTMFIATLSGEDSPEWEGDQIYNSAYLTARVSPNGRYLAFMSEATITGYDNVDASPAANGARDEEVYLYDAATATLRCVSCNPTGARPAGVLDMERSGEGLGLLVDRRLVWGREKHEHWLAGNIPGWTARSLTSAIFQSRYLSDQGRLYFNSPDTLVPAAVNHKENVYEYEPSGVGSCQSPSGGCVSLISGGSSAHESAFLEATPDGSSVFFLTEAQLIPSEDTDTAFDIYDARECTAASSCITPPAPAPAPCAETETCRAAPPAQQIPGVAASTAEYSGTGNVTPSEPPVAKHEVEARKAKRPLTRTQKRNRALKACRKHHPHSKKKRKRCEQNARRHYPKRPKAHKTGVHDALGTHARKRGR
jgi:hypothetical protein